MLVEKIKYKDFNGVEREDEEYFNFTEAEIQEMNLRSPGGLAAKLKRITKTKDPDELVSYFKNLILDSYGVISEDGRSFIKIDPKTGRPLSERFSQTAAYNALFMKLSTNTEDAVRFVNGIVPEVSDTTSSGVGGNLTPVESLA